MAIGNDLLALPFAQVVAQLAMGVAEAQKQLDAHAMEQLITMIDKLQELNKESGASAAEPAKATVELLGKLKEFGLAPTFYQFADTEVEVRMAISTSKDTELKVGGGLKLSAVTLDASYTQKYSYRAEGSSVLRTKIVPSLPPQQLAELLEAANKHKLLELSVPKTVAADPKND